MTNAKWLGNYTIPGYELYDLGHYPAVVSGNGAVYGEVYRIDSTTLAELDALRTKSGEYKRGSLSARPTAAPGCICTSVRWTV